MTDIQTVTLRGKLMYAKVLGDPVLNYNKDGKEWKVDFYGLDKDSLAELKSLGILDRVKQKEGYIDGEKYLSFKHRELKKDGRPNDPIRVVDVGGNPWDQNTLIGNGTDADIKFVVVDYGKGMKKGVYIRSIRVLKLVPFAKKEFEELSPDDEFYQEAQAALLSRQKKDSEFKRDFGIEELDDEIGI